MRLACYIVSCSIALALAGCDSRSSSSKSVATGTTRASSSVDVVQPKIRWPSATLVDHATRVALPLDAQRLLTRSPVPVLVPPKDVRLDAVKLVVDDEFYAFSAKLETGASIVVQGTRARVRIEGVEPVPGRMALHGDVLGHVTENEGIRVATWIENETSYSVDLECVSPEEAQCTSDDQVIALAKSLVFVGGEGSQ